MTHSSLPARLRTRPARRRRRLRVTRTAFPDRGRSPRPKVDARYDPRRRGCAGDYVVLCVSEKASCAGPGEQPERMWAPVSWFILTVDAAGVRYYLTSARLSG